MNSVTHLTNVLSSFIDEFSGGLYTKVQRFWFPIVVWFRRSQCNFTVGMFTLLRWTEVSILLCIRYYRRKYLIKFWLKVTIVVFKSSLVSVMVGKLSVDNMLLTRLGQPRLSIIAEMYNVWHNLILWKMCDRDSVFWIGLMLVWSLP